MRVNRALLYGGAFLVALGGVLVAADAGRVDTTTLADVIRLWPVAVIAIGAGLVLRRTRLSLAGGLAAAALPGLLVGSGLAIVPRFHGDCGVREAPVISRTDAGLFIGPASVSVKGACGSLTVSTTPGAGWRLDSGNTAGRTPVIEADESSLSIYGSRGGWNALNWGRDVWSLTLPTSRIEDLGLVVNAGTGRVGLPGADIGHLGLVANLGDFVLDASGASLDDLSATLNWSNTSLHLPSGSDLSGAVHLNNGELEVCAPPGLGLSVDTRGPGRTVTAAGLDVPGGDWQSPDFDTALYRANFDVTANFGVVAINPIGGCR
jgi:hypothetical protein